MALRIRFLKEGHHYAPWPYCDECGEAIMRGSMAMLCWRIKPDEVQTYEDGNTLDAAMYHKGPCHRAAEARDKADGYLHLDEELMDLPVRFAANLNIGDRPDLFKQFVQDPINELGKRIAAGEPY